MSDTQVVGVLPKRAYRMDAYICVYFTMFFSETLRINGEVGNADRKCKAKKFGFRVWKTKFGRVRREGV